MHLLNNSLKDKLVDSKKEKYLEFYKKIILDELTDDAILRQQLEDLGYAEVASEITINSAVNEYAPLEGESNWFDKFCEFVGSIFGG